MLRNDKQYLRSPPVRTIFVCDHNASICIWTSHHNASVCIRPSRRDNAGLSIFTRVKANLRLSQYHWMREEDLLEISETRRNNYNSWACAPAPEHASDFGLPLHHIQSLQATSRILGCILPTFAGKYSRGPSLRKAFRFLYLIRDQINEVWMQELQSRVQAVKGPIRICKSSMHRSLLQSSFTAYLKSSWSRLDPSGRYIWHHWQSISKAK